MDDFKANDVHFFTNFKKVKFKSYNVKNNGFRFRVQNNKIAVKMTCILAYKIASHFLLI